MPMIPSIIKKAYDAFNARDIETVLSTMQQDVHWPNGWEGGYVNGHDEVRDYWTRQWAEIDPHVNPLSISQREDGSIEVVVHQVAKDMAGNILSDAVVKHIYEFENNKIKRMEIEKA
jgi:hypothetical protein